MTQNVGTTDRIVRAAIAAPLLVVAALFAGVTEPIGVIAVVAATVMLATSAAGFCPLYRLFGVSTCRRSARVG